MGHELESHTAFYETPLPLFYVGGKELLLLLMGEWRALHHIVGPHLILQFKKTIWSHMGVLFEEETLFKKKEY